MSKSSDYPPFKKLTQNATKKVIFVLSDTDIKFESIKLYYNNTNKFDPPPTKKIGLISWKVIFCSRLLNGVVSWRIDKKDCGRYWLVGTGEQVERRDRYSAVPDEIESWPPNREPDF